MVAISGADSDNACDLLSENDGRSTSLDESPPSRPQVALVSKPFALACRAEGLAGAAPSPHGPVIRPAGGSEGAGPHADAGKEVALNKSREVFRPDVLDRAPVHHAGSDEAGGDEVSEPLGGVGVGLIVPRRHDSSRARSVDRARANSGSTPAR